MNMRPAESDDLDPLATLWHSAWHETHAHLMPAELTRLRTLASFRDRLDAARSDIRVVGPAGAPTAFCIVKDDELYQLFAAPAARGTGAAAALVADAEARLAAAGVHNAWLACAIGNARAARFYEKCGWHNTGTFTDLVETSNGPFALDVWRYEKVLRTPSPA